MNNDIKSGVGYIIPLAAVIGFFTALFLGEYLLSVFVAIAGILVWFLYMVVMESSPPSNLCDMHAKYADVINSKNVIKYIKSLNNKLFDLPTGNI